MPIEASNIGNGASPVAHIGHLMKKFLSILHQKNKNSSEKYRCATKKCCKKHPKVLPMDRDSQKRARSDSQKQTGEPEEEDSPPGSQKRDFQQVTKSEPNGISACGLQHPLLLVEIYP